MLAAFWLLPAGVAIATVAIGIGIGGGILWTPLLVLGFDLTPRQAVATSLVIQVVGLGSGTVAHTRSGRVDRRLSALFFAVGAPGVVAGSFATVRLAEGPVKLALGAMALTLALVFVSARAEGRSRRGQAATAGRLLPIPAVLGALLGLLSVGVGEWLIPSLRRRLGLGMKQAVATVVPTMFLLVSLAALCHGLLSENIRWDLFAFAAPGALIGAQLGPRVADRLDDRVLKEAFVFALTLVGIHLIFQAL